MDLNNKRILVLGLSKSGIAASKLAVSKGATVYISEGNNLNKKYADILDELYDLDIKIEFGGHTDKFINNLDFVVTSPGISPYSDIIQKLKKLNIEVISELEFAYRMTNIPFVVITGTNGKTTTTSLTEHIFKKNFNVAACGNIGNPPSNLVDVNLDYFICEASSFQLEMTSTFKPFISVWTNFTPDHIDWHKGLENYFNAKAKIFTDKQAAQYSVINANDNKLLEFSEQISSNLFYFGRKLGKNCCYIENNYICYMSNSNSEKIISLDDCPIFGQHNYENIMCAIICARIVGIDAYSIAEAIMSFKAPAHRMEKVRTYKNITFYNDSKATNPEASIVAINSFNNTDVVLIAGGRDKNTSLDEFCNSVIEHVSNVILIGEASDRFEKELILHGFTNISRVDSLQKAIDKSIDLNPNVVLLSPACASFDMFTGYEQRGDVFKDYVLSRI